MRRACREAVREWAAPAGGVDAGSGVSRSGNSTVGISGSSAAGVAGAESESATGLSDLGFLGFFFLRSSSIWRGGISVVVEGGREVLKVDAPSFWRRPVFRLWQPLRQRLRSRPLVVNWSGLRWVWFRLDVVGCEVGVEDVVEDGGLDARCEVLLPGRDWIRAAGVLVSLRSRRRLQPSQANSFPYTLPR